MYIYIYVYMYIYIYIYIFIHMCIHIYTLLGDTARLRESFFDSFSKSSYFPQTDYKHDNFDTLSHHFS